MSYRPYQQIVRRKSRQIRVGNVLVGGDAPVSVQTMTNTPTEDAAATIAQIRRAEIAGVDIVPAEDGSLLVLEVNSMPAWSGLQSVAAVNIADAIAEALLKAVANRAEATRPYRFASPANA